MLRRSRRSARALVAAGLVTALLLVVAMVIVTYRSTLDFERASRLVSHSREVLATVNDAYARLRSAESNQRAYVMTGAPVYISAARADFPRVRDAITRLRLLVADDPDQARDAKELNDAVEAKLALIETMIEARQREGFEAAQKLLVQGEPRVAMDHVSQIVDRISADEQRLLDERDRRSERQAGRTKLIVIIGGATDFALLAFTMWLVLRDQRRDRESAKALSRSRDAALEVANAKSAFLANMSHEIRTPLNAVIGMTGLLLGTKLDDNQRDLASTVRSSANSLLAIVNDILDFSKIEAGKISIERMEFDVRRLVEAVVELVNEEADLKGIELASFVEKDVPQTLIGDPARVRQVLTNLVSNAVKFTEKGQVVIRVQKYGETMGRTNMRFSVTDTGIGIDEETIGRLFQPFSQADASMSRRFGGTGLGLAISRQLVDLMGGTMDVESTPDQGSTFSFTLLMETSTAEVAEERLPAMGGVRVLVVDDNEITRLMVHHNLDAWQLSADDAVSVATAVQKLHSAAGANRNYELALIDHQLPDGDGIALARQISNDPALPGTHVILLTSVAARPDDAELERNGISGCVTKPIKQSSLFNAIASALAPASASPEPAVAHKFSSDAKVLVAEDHPVNRKLAVRQLEGFGIHADTVENGRLAVEALRNRRYDLVFMDCQMPEMDGFEATAEIRMMEGEERHTPIIALTANALAGDRDRCLAAGMDDYISKPVAESELERVIRAYVPESPLNEVTLQGLRDLGSEDDDVLAEIIQLYVDDAPGRLDTMRAALTASDAESLASAAHALKSSSANVGAPRVRDLCEEIETIGREGKIDGARALFERLETEYARAKTALEKL